MAYATWILSNRAETQCMQNGFQFKSMRMKLSIANHQVYTNVSWWSWMSARWDGWLFPVDAWIQLLNHHNTLGLPSYLQEITGLYIQTICKAFSRACIWPASQFWIMQNAPPTQNAPPSTTIHLLAVNRPMVSLKAIHTEPLQPPR